MRLLLVSSVLFVSAMAIQPTDSNAKLGESKNKVAGNQENIEQFKSRMTEKTKALFEKDFGGDIEERRMRLAKLSEKFRGKQISPEKPAEIKENLANIKKFKTGTSNVTVPTLLEVNDLAGVSDYLFEGDINLSNAQLEHLERMSDRPVEGTRVKRQTTILTPKWTNATLVYYIDPSISARKKDLIGDALRYITQRTCITTLYDFDKGMPNRIKITSGAGCHSSVGMIGGEQTLSLGDGCDSFSTVVHELMHALGVWHTQQRSDRNDYVRINWSAIKADEAYNFDRKYAFESSLLVPYDFGSVMHYPPNAFVKNAGDISIIPTDNQYLYTMGSKMVSFYDLLNINEFYGCSAKCSDATAAKCKNGGYPVPHACHACVCPLGYGGQLCDQRPPGYPTACGVELTATTDWQSHTFDVGNKTERGLRDKYTYCTNWITAPQGKTIQVELSNMWDYDCQYGCDVAGIEFKTNADPRATNPRVCCEDRMYKGINGQLNPMPVVAWNRKHWTQFTFWYRYW